MIPVYTQSFPKSYDEREAAKDEARGALLRESDPERRVLAYAKWGESHWERFIETNDAPFVSFAQYMGEWARNGCVEALKDDAVYPLLLAMYPEPSKRVLDHGYSYKTRGTPAIATAFGL